MANKNYFKVIEIKNKYSQLIVNSRTGERDYRIADASEKGTAIPQRSIIDPAKLAKARQETNEMLEMIGSKCRV